MKWNLMSWVSVFTPDLESILWHDVRALTPRYKSALKRIIISIIIILGELSNQVNGKQVWKKPLARLALRIWSCENLSYEMVKFSASKEIYARRVLN